jgi:hypothetical protein
MRRIVRGLTSNRPAPVWIEAKVSGAFSVVGRDRLCVVMAVTSACSEDPLTSGARDGSVRYPAEAMQRCRSGSVSHAATESVLSGVGMVPRL